MREEGVAQLTLELAGRTDDDAAHREAKVACDARHQEQRGGVAAQLRGGHPLGQIVDRELQVPGAGQRQGGGGHDTEEPADEGRMMRT